MKHIKYIHDEISHNLQDPEIIVPLLIDVLKPESVVDLGCGIGTFLHVFADKGVSKILGLDGDWVNRELLSKYIDLVNFKIINIEQKFEIEEKFDLAICLEVFEHIDATFADVAVHNLINLSNIIVFSAAIPGQLGQNHLNEQWPEYWIKKFKLYGFKFHDVLRPIFWNNKKLARWYKQNMYLIVKEGYESRIENFIQYFDSEIKAQVHPEYFNLRVNQLKEVKSKYNLLLNQFSSIQRGQEKLNSYLKLIYRYFLHRLSDFKIFKNWQLKNYQ